MTRPHQSDSNSHNAPRGQIPPKGKLEIIRYFHRLMLSENNPIKVTPAQLIAVYLSNGRKARAAGNLDSARNSFNNARRLTSQISNEEKRLKKLQEIMQCQENAGFTQDAGDTKVVVRELETIVTLPRINELIMHALVSVQFFGFNGDAGELLLAARKLALELVDSKEKIEVLNSIAYYQEGLGFANDAQDTGALIQEFTP